MTTISEHSTPSISFLAMIQARSTIKEIGQEEDGRIFLIDVGMSPAIDYSKGLLLLINTNGNEVVATSLDADGQRKEVCRGTFPGWANLNPVIRQSAKVYADWPCASRRQSPRPASSSLSSSLRKASFPV